MKVVTWNCNGALRNKTREIDSLNADILVIQECENPAESTTTYRDWAGEYLWVGSSKNKGVGVFARNEYSLSKLEWDGFFKIVGFNKSHPSMSWKTNELELFLPCKINDEFTILAAWTKSSNSPNFGYMGQFWKYLQIHRTEFSQPKMLIVGDFNSNSIWDQADRWWSHSDVVNELRDIGVESLYHHQFNEEQGRETVPTFYLHRKEHKPYHIDYVFLSADLITQGALTIGQRVKWISVSDHMPLSVEINR